MNAKKQKQIRQLSGPFMVDLVMLEEEFSGGIDYQKSLARCRDHYAKVVGHLQPDAANQMTTLFEALDFCVSRNARYDFHEIHLLVTTLYVAGRI